jgi:hypothetical protein
MRPNGVLGSARRVELKNRWGRILGVCARRDTQCAVATCMDPDLRRSLGVPGCSGANNRLVTAPVPARQARSGRHIWRQLPRERGPVSGAPNALARFKPARPPQFARNQPSFHSRWAHVPVADADFPKPCPPVAVASARRVELKNRLGRILGVCVRR